MRLPCEGPCEGPVCSFVAPRKTSRRMRGHRPRWRLLKKGIGTFWPENVYCKEFLPGQEETRPASPAAKQPAAKAPPPCLAVTCLQRRCECERHEVAGRQHRRDVSCCVRRMCRSSHLARRQINRPPMLRRLCLQPLG